MGLLRGSAVLLAASAVGNAQNWFNPEGVPYPDTTYPEAVEDYTLPGAQSFQVSPPYYPSPWGGLDSSVDEKWADAYEKARAFVSDLTLTEKVNLTTGVGWEGEKCVGNNGDIPRIGFKSLCLQDSPLGIRFADYSSAFPAGVTIASTWDRKLMYKRGLYMGTEHRSKGIDVQLGPAIGPLGRSPTGGRNWEGFSPDPVLTGIAVGETVKGIQDAGVIACTKHYIVNEQEHFRQGGGNLTISLSSNLDDRTMHELYLWPFADAVRAGTGAIMCSYNQINNSYACQNSDTQNRLLKGELGFQGFILSDWAAQHSGVSSALAGLDQTMPGDQTFDSGNSYWGSNLTIAVLNGTVPQWRLDDMCVRILASWYYVDRPGNQVENAPSFSSWDKNTFGYKNFYAKEDYTQINWHTQASIPEHQQHIRESAARSIVMLKNKGVLPLSGEEKLTGVFGSDAGDNQYGPNGCNDRGCDNGTLAMGWGSGTADFPYLVTPLTAIQNEVRSKYGNVEAVTDDYAYTQIQSLAQKVDQVDDGVSIVFVNSDAGEGYIIVDGNEGDRNNLTAWHDGDTLIKNVTSLSRNVVVVVHSVGPILINEWYDNENVTAILWASIPGQESGNALADVLYGRVNPSGKLPFTIGKSRRDYGTDVLYVPNNGDFDAPQDNFQEGIFIDYRGFDRRNVTPVYEFGFGLSYTNFSYSNIAVVKHDAPEYTKNTGFTEPAQNFGSISNNTADHVFPPGFNQLKAYIYPFLNASTLSAASQDPQYGLNYTFPADAYDASAQPVLPAGGAPGGNKALYDVLFTVTTTVTNTGAVEGEEVPQLYVALGGPDDAKKVLRNFDKFSIAPGASEVFSADITRRDLSNWDIVAQDWYISIYPKQVFVGSSSQKLPLSAPLDITGTTPGGSGGSGNYTAPVEPSAPVQTASATSWNSKASWHWDHTMSTRTGYHVPPLSTTHVYGDS